MLDFVALDARSFRLVRVRSRLEATWLSGAVARMAAEAGLAAPVSATLFAAVKPYINGARN